VRQWELPTFFLPAVPGQELEFFLSSGLIFPGRRLGEARKHLEFGSSALGAGAHRGPPRRPPGGAEVCRTTSLTDRAGGTSGPPLGGSRPNKNPPALDPITALPPPGALNPGAATNVRQPKGTQGPGLGVKSRHSTNTTPAGQSRGGTPGGDGGRTSHRRTPKFWRCIWVRRHGDDGGGVPGPGGVRDFLSC